LPRAISGILSYAVVVSVGKWHTVSMKVTDEQLAALNQRLQQLGFGTMGDYARALTQGVVGNRQLVEDLAETLVAKLVVKMTTSAAPAADASQAMKRGMRSPGFEPGSPVLSDYQLGGLMSSWRDCD